MHDVGAILKMTEISTKDDNGASNHASVGLQAKHDQQRLNQPPQGPPSNASRKNADEETRPDGALPVSEPASDASSTKAKAKKSYLSIKDAPAQKARTKCDP